MRNLRRAMTVGVEVLVLMVLIALSPILVPIILWFVLRDA